MWSSRPNRRVFLLGAFAALSACQLRPALAPGGAAVALQGQVGLPAPKSRDEFDLVTRLRQRLGQPGPSPRWDLSINLSVAADGFSGPDSRRSQLIGTLELTLTPRRPTDRALQEEVRAMTAFADVNTNASRTNFVLSNRAAGRAAHARLMTLLADRAVDRMITELARVPR